MTSPCMAMLKITILSAEVLSKLVLALLLLPDTTLSMYGVAMLLIMWLPAIVLVADNMFTSGAASNKMSAGQVMAVLLLFPFLPTLTNMLSVYNRSLPSPMQHRLVELMSLPGVVSSSLQMVLVMWCMLTGVFSIYGKFARYSC